MKRIAMCGLVLSLGCHAHQGAPTATASTSASPSGAESSATTPTGGRDFDARSTFGDLLARAEPLETDAGERPSCLLGSVNGLPALAAAIVPAMHPLPPPETDVETRFGESQGVTVLTRWGRHGAGSLGVATLTAVPPLLDEPLVVVFVTSRQILLRATATGAIPEGAVEVSPSALATSIAPGVGAVVVTADARVPVARVRDVLSRLDATGTPIALGTVLPSGARLPAVAPPMARTNVERCDALPELPPEAHEGDLSVPALRDGFARLGNAVSTCLHSTSSARVARGGRLEVLVRIAPDGEAKLACARADTIEDDGFRMCLVSAARALRFALPSPPGYVDAAFPITIAPDTTMANRAICAP